MHEAAEIVLGGVFVGAVFSLVALGFTLVFRVSGVVNLSQGAFVVLGALTLYSFEVRLHWPLPVAFVASMVLVAAVGAGLEALVVRPAIARLPTSGLLILTAGLLTIFEGASLLIWGSQPYAIPSFSGEQPLLVLGLRLPTQDVWIAAAELIIVCGIWLTLTKTTLGKALRATAENRDAASLMGIDVARMSLLSFAAGAAIGAVGGMVLGPVTSLQFDSGGYFTNTGFIAVALGGMGSFVGAVLGGLGLGVIQQAAAGYISSLFANSLAFVALLAVLLLRPSGLFGRETGRVDAPPAGHRVASSIVLGVRPWWALLAGLVMLVALLPPLLDGTGLLQSFVIAGVWFIAVLGLDLLMGYGGQVSLGNAGFMAIGGYTAAILVTRYQAPSMLAVGAGVALSLLTALLLALATARLRGLYMALATLAFGLLVDTLIVGLSDLTGGPSGLVGIPAFSIGPLELAGDTANFYLVWGVGLVLLVLSWNLARSGFGRALQAIRADQTAARALGIRVSLHKAMALMLSAGYASIAGSLYAFDFHFLSPDMVSTSHSLEMVTMLVVGGQASLIGPLLGATFITTLPTVVQPLAMVKTLIEGALLVLILLYAPGGIFGLAGAAVSRLRRQLRRFLREPVT